MGTNACDLKAPILLKPFVPNCSGTYPARYSLVAFVLQFDIDSGKASRGDSRHAFENEADSLSVFVADALVSNLIRSASTFERDRVGKLHRLHRRSFNFSQSFLYPAQYQFRSSIYLPCSAYF